MNYAAHYDRLIARARGRVFEGYRERHHVLPRCMGGGDEAGNIVNLTAEEHFVAHQLLIRMYPFESKLVHAAWYMAIKGRRNKAYGWLRRRHAKVKAEQMRGNEYGKALLGRKRGPMSDEQKEKLSVVKKGCKPTRTGAHSAESRAKMSAALKGRVISPEWAEKVAAANRGRKYPPRSQEWSANISAYKKGRPGYPCSPETRAKLSAIKRAHYEQRVR